MNFDSVVKYLDLRRATVDSTEVTKPLSLDKSRAIKKVQDTLLLSPYDVGPVFFSYPRLMFQYNVTVGYPFTFRVNPNTFTAIRGGTLFIKWRVGSTVYRYRISDTIVTRTPNTTSRWRKLKQFYVYYEGQVIPSNCVFEFWYSLTSLVVGIQSPGVELTLSKLRNPVTPDDIGTQYPQVKLTIADLGVALPETLPYTQDNQVWLNN